MREFFGFLLVHLLARAEHGPPKQLRARCWAGWVAIARRSKHWRLAAVAPAPFTFVPWLRAVNAQMRKNWGATFLHRADDGPRPLQ
jgi:hypothetical protein